MESPDTQKLPHPKITIFLEYEYLTAEQAAQLFQAVDGLYKAVVDALVYDGFEYTSGHQVIYHPVPLVVKKADTSQSLELVFELAAETVSVLVKDGNINVALPEWAAVVWVTGKLLRWSLESYDKALEAIKRHKDLKKMKLELEKLEKESAARARIQAHQYHFKNVTLSNNFTKVMVNDVPLIPVARESE